MDTRDPRRAAPLLVALAAAAACSSPAARRPAALPAVRARASAPAPARRAELPGIGPLIVTAPRGRHAGTCDDPALAAEGDAPAVAPAGGGATVYAITLSRPGRVALGTRIGFSLCVRARCDDEDSALPGACLPEAGYAHELVADLPAGRSYVLVSRRANVSELSGPDAVRLDARPSAGTTAAEVCASARALEPGGAAAEGTLRPHEAFDFGTVPTACGAIDYARPAAFRLALPARSRVRVRAEAAAPAADPAADASDPLGGAGRATSPFALVPVIRGACADARTDLACGDAEDPAPRAPWEAAALLAPGEFSVLVGANTALGAPLPFRVRAETAPPGGAGGVPGDAPAGPLAPLLPAVEGDTFAARDDARPSCAREPGGADVHYALDLARRSLVELWVDRAPFAAVVSARPAGAHAGDDDLLCASEPTARAPALASLAPGRYVVSVDGASPGEFGRFALASLVREAAPVERACAGAPALVPGVAVRGATRAGPGGDRFTPSCATERGAPDAVYRLVLRQRARVGVTASAPGQDHNPVVSIRRQCMEPSSEVACAPPHPSHFYSAIGGDESVVGGAPAVELEPGTYYVFVDGQGASHAGAFELRASAEPPGGD